MQLAINVLKWPGMNVAFIFSFVLSNVLAFAAIPYAKRRPKGTATTWGEAMLASVYVFGTFFIAFGVVPHQFIDHADKNLHWNKAKILYGPFGILKPTALGGSFPMTIPYEAVRDIVVVLLHVYYFALVMFLWSYWQKRGTKKTSEVAMSTYGRPLVKQA